MKKFTLVGPGLSGTTRMHSYFVNELGLERIMDSQEGKCQTHTRIVPKERPCNVLFIYADPRNILLSCINRSIETNIFDTWLYRHCKQVEGDCEFAANIPIQKTSDIEYILNTNYDPLRLEGHFMNWLTADINYRMMMLKYEALANPKTFQKVLDFFEIEGDYDYGWNQRKTSYLNLPIEQQVQITNLFKSLLKKQAELPPVYIR